MAAFDVIGDVHGHGERLERLLSQLGYRHRSGAWRHADRTAVFVGDLIDRGPEQRQTVDLVRSMVDAGSARMVVGNHEFNAVAFATTDPGTGSPCRPHSEKNLQQHGAFLSELGLGSRKHIEVIDWFRTLPLCLDLGGLRVVHACWSTDDFAHLSRRHGGDCCLTTELVVDASTKGSRSYIAVENVLKGPELAMDGAYYVDKDGHRRDQARVCWWDATATTLRRAAVIPGGTTLHDPDGNLLVALPDRMLASHEIPRYTDPVPVVFGHYWFTGAPATLGPFATCVDYSAGKGGPIVACRWDGEPTLDDVTFLSC